MYGPGMWYKLLLWLVVSVGYGRFSPRDDAGYFALGIGSSRVVTLLFGFGLCLGWRVVSSWSSFSNVLLERCYLDIPPILCDSNLSNAQ